MGAGQHIYFRKLEKELFSSPNIADDIGKEKACDAPNAIFPDEKRQ